MKSPQGQFVCRSVAGIDDRPRPRYRQRAAVCLRRCRPPRAVWVRQWKRSHCLAGARTSSQDPRFRSRKCVGFLLDSSPTRNWIVEDEVHNCRVSTLYGTCIDTQILTALSLVTLTASRDGCRRGYMSHRIARYSTGIAQSITYEGMNISCDSMYNSRSTLLWDAR